MYKLMMLILVLSQIAGCANFPRIYSGEAIHGWVVDSKTKQPIENVVVLEIWELRGHQHILDMESSINGYAHIAETLTDEQGYYAFSEWGPELTTYGRMSEWSPQLVFYKFGYDDVQLSNSVTGNLNPDNRKSEHSGKTIELEKHEGSPDEYRTKISPLSGVLSSHRKGLECTWAKIPRFTSEMIKVSEYLKKYRVNFGFFPDLDSFSEESRCGNRDELLMDYLK